MATSWIPAAGLATSGHCPGPWVGRDGQVPSQPTAAAGAGPDFSCAGELEQPPKALIGEVRSLSVVCVCVSGSVGRAWSCGRSSFVLVVWGGSPASGWRVSSIFPAKEKNLCRRFFRVRLPIWGPVRVPVGMPPPSSIPLFVMFHCLRRRRPGSRATCIRWWRVRTLLVDYARGLGVRGALFSWFAAVACFSCLD